MIRWDAPGPYVVAFTTREGGVSTAEHASLNLGSRFDEPARIQENRRIACTELGLAPELLVANRQRHTTTVRRAVPGAPVEVGGRALERRARRAGPRPDCRLRAGCDRHHVAARPRSPPSTPAGAGSREA